MSKIETRTVASHNKNEQKNSLIGYKFIIKDYQRGYRWEKKQVRELLNDINSFATTSEHKMKYCMQPLVVKKIDDINTNNSLNDYIQSQDSSVKSIDFSDIYELIDGQQRLTTALLILCKCNQTALPYQIEYSLFRKIDKFYIDNALKTIDEWFEENGDPITIDTLKHEIKTKVLLDLQFIWYEVDANANSIDIFTKLNIGKIPLTNAELFKALLLNEDNINDDIQKKIELSKIAIEWDTIEQSLRDDEFWGFISRENSDKETRIDFLLRLFAISEKQNSNVFDDYTTDDPLFPFLLVCEMIKKQGATISDIWSNGIVFIHDMLKSWYENIELFHYIGFLVQVSKNPSMCLIELIAQTKSKKKSEINLCIQDKIKEEFRGIVIDDLEFDDKEKIRKVLLFFNIYTMIKSKTKTRFSFKQFNDMKWNIEHIHSRADEQELRRLDKTDSKRDMLNTLRNQFVIINDINSVSEIDQFIRDDLANATTDQFVTFYLRKTEEYGGVDIDHIGNFTLLDEETNKSYHNALYPIKRNRIIERDKGEVFIPVCTKNVFLKMYSRITGDPYRWTRDDAQDYINAIKEALVMEAKVCQ